MLAPLVGRELDLAVCLEQLKRVERGATTALLVRGDGGIGKSRLVAELASRARQLGHPVLIGRADDLDHGIPYAVFRDLLARLALAEPLRAEVGARADDLRRSFEPSGHDEPGEHYDAELPAVFATAVRLCRALAEDGPAVLVLEDLHVADRESLALTALLARLADVPMLTVVTLRPGTGTDVERLLEEMADDGRGAVVDLEPLDRHETQALVASVLGATPDDALTDTIFTSTRGNPFFTQELTRSFAEGGAAVVDEGHARLVGEAPAAGLRPSASLLRRLFGGTSLDVELAKVMSVFGRFSVRHLPLVQRLLGHSAHEVGHAFDRLVKAGLLVESAGGYEFTHSIVRATLYEDIGPAERRRIHAAVAAELATERRAGTLLDVLELATHVAESAEAGDDAAADVLLDAGRTIAATAPLVSAGYLRRAAALLPEGSPLRAAALAGQTRALHLGSRPAEAAEVGRAALAALTAQPGNERRASTVAFVVNDLYLCGGVHEALGILDVELAGEGNPCPLLAMRVNMLMQAGRYAEADAQFDAALAALAGPRASELMAISHLVQYANHVGRVNAAAAMLDRLDQLAVGASPTIELAVHELAPFADWRPGVVGRLERRLESARRLRPDAAALSIGGTFELNSSRLLWMRGDWDRALDVIRRASFDLEQRGATVPAHLLLCLGCEVLVDRGALDEAAAVADRLVTPIVTLSRIAALVRARIHRALGELDAAERLLVGEWDAAAPPRASVWKVADVLAELAAVQVELGRAGEAAATVDALDALAARTGWPECQAPALRSRALVHRDADAASALAALAERESWDVEGAHAALLLGELDVDPGRHLTAAYHQFDTFGAAPWRRRAAAGLRGRGLSVPRRAAQAKAGLNETEVQLVRLVRDGLTNRQIATAMHYSTKTIEVYLSRVYAKTGCASRLELIRAVDTGAVDS